MRKLILLTSFLSFSYAAVFAQSKLNTVYAGTEFWPSANGGMETFANAFYFRPDGTYCNELGKSDWKTRISGTYTLVGRKITMTSNTGKKESMTLDNDGSLSAQTYNLFKFDMVNTIPANNYINQDGSSAGGNGTPYAGTYSESNIAFDGRGVFSHSAFRTTMYNGNNAGGGGTRKDGGHGNYSLRDGTLTLQYDNGKTVSKSFFFRNGNETVMALINGTIYYKSKERLNVPAGNSQQTPNTNRTNTSSPPPARETPTASIGKSTPVDGKSVLQKANLVHGGKSLDQLKTFRVDAVVSGINVVMIADVVQQKIRYEYYNGGKLGGIEQVEGNTGWQWINGKISSLSAEQLKTMQGVFSRGLFALRSQVIKNTVIQKAQVDVESKLTSVLVTTNNNEQIGFVFDAENRLVGETNVTDGKKQNIFSKDFKTVDGLLIGFTTNQTMGSQSLLIKYSSVSVNPVLNEKSWSKPE
jgi:hypothetical protein